MTTNLKPLADALGKITHDPDGRQIATEVMKAVHRQARPASPPPARPGKLKKIVNGDASLRKLVLD
jgi:hypothetical protein